MKYALVLVSVLVVAGCQGLTKEDVEQERFSQQDAWSRATQAAVEKAIESTPGALAGGPPGWIIGALTVVGAGVSAYVAARSPGSARKPPKPPE